MKWTSLILFGFLLLGCDGGKVAELQEQNTVLVAEVDSMREQADMRHEFIEQYTLTLNEVYDNLERIRKREGLHMKMTRELEGGNAGTVQKEELLSNINSIDTYLQDSKEKMGRLQQMVRDSRIKAVTMDSAISQLTRMVEAKESELSTLRDQVEDLSFRVTVAEAELETKERVIESQTEQLNQAYYVIGSEKELKERGIIVERGGILGLRQTKILADNFSNDEFISTSIHETGEIVIDEKTDDVRIISTHHPDSYHLVQLEGEQTLLEIIDPQEFWKIKYLVIQKG